MLGLKKTRVKSRGTTGDLESCSERQLTRHNFLIFSGFVVGRQTNAVTASKGFERLNKMEHAEVLWTSVLRQTSDENAMGGARGGVIDFRGFHR